MFANMKRFTAFMLALVMVFAAAGVESIVGGIIKFKEAKEATKPDVSEETEAENNGRAE